MAVNDIQTQEVYALKIKLNHYELKITGLEQDKVRFRQEEKKHMQLIEEH